MMQHTPAAGPPPVELGTDRSPLPPPSDGLNGALADRLGELMAVTPLLPELPGCEIRGHVAGVRAFLHDDVLRHASAEEVALFPVFARLGRDGERLRAGLVVEHDTIREATGPARRGPSDRATREETR